MTTVHLVHPARHFEYKFEIPYDNNTIGSTTIYACPNDWTDSSVVCLSKTPGYISTYDNGAHICRSEHSTENVLFYVADMLRSGQFEFTATATEC